MKDDPYFGGFFVWMVILFLAGVGFVCYQAAWGDAYAQLILSFMAFTLLFVAIAVGPALLIGFGIQCWNRWKGS